MFFDGIACLMKGLTFVQAGVPSCPDDVTLRSCANFKCDVADVNTQILRTHFRGVKCVSDECYQPFRENKSWYVRSDCLVQQIFNQSPPTQHIFNSLLAPAIACESQTTACDIEIILDMLWIGVNCIFKESIFSMYWSISFSLKDILFQFL